MAWRGIPNLDLARLGFGSDNRPRVSLNLVRFSYTGWIEARLILFVEMVGIRRSWGKGLVFCIASQEDDVIDPVVQDGDLDGSVHGASIAADMRKVPLCSRVARDQIMATPNDRMHVRPLSPTSDTGKAGGLPDDLGPGPDIIPLLDVERRIYVDLGIVGIVGRYVHVRPPVRSPVRKMDPVHAKAQLTLQEGEVELLQARAIAQYERLSRQFCTP